MDIKRIAAIGYTIVTVVVVVFQIALACVSWAAYAMGGAFPGQFPPTLRVGAVVQAALLLLMAAVIYRGEVLRCPDGHGRPAGWPWVVVAFAVVSLVLYPITPSVGERMIWVPVAVLLLVTVYRRRFRGPANVPGTTPGTGTSLPGASSQVSPFLYSRLWFIMEPCQRPS